MTLLTFFSENIHYKLIKPTKIWFPMYMMCSSFGNKLGNTKLRGFIIETTHTRQYVPLNVG